MFDKKKFTEKTGNFTDTENKKFVDAGDSIFVSQNVKPHTESVETQGQIPPIMQTVGPAEPQDNVPIGASFTPDNTFSKEDATQNKSANFIQLDNNRFNNNAQAVFFDKDTGRFSNPAEKQGEVLSAAWTTDFNVPDTTFREMPVEGKFKNADFGMFKPQEPYISAHYAEHVKYRSSYMDKLVYKGNPAVGHVTSTSAVYHKDVKIAFSENSKRTKDGNLVMQKGPSVKAHIRFDDKMERKFSDRASGFLDTINELNKENEAAASNADDLVVTTIDALVAKEMSTVTDYRTIEKEADRDIKFTEKTEKQEQKDLKKAEKFKDKAEARFAEKSTEYKKAKAAVKENPTEESYKDYKKIKEQFLEAKDNFKDKSEKFDNLKKTVEFNKNNANVVFDEKQERFLDDETGGWKSKRNIRKETKFIKKEKKEEIRAKEKEKKESKETLKEKGKEKKAETKSRFHEQSSEFVDDEKYFGSKDKRFERTKESRFTNKPVTVLAVKNETTAIAEYSEKNLPGKIKEKAGENDKKEADKKAIDKHFKDETDKNPTVSREQKKEMDKAKKKAAKEEKNKALAKAGAVAAVSKMFKAKADIQNDIMREGNADDLIASGKSSMISNMLNKINPKDVLTEKMKQAMKKMLLKIAPFLLIVCMAFVVASIPVVTIGCIIAQSDAGDEGYDPLSPNAFTGGDGKEFASLSQDKIDTIIKKVYKSYPDMDSRHEKVLRYALSKVGCPYNQNYHARNDVDIFDCSSLTFRSYKQIGVNISYRGASTAAEEAKGLIEKNASVSGDYQPGDLIFWGGSSNGRYMGIYHTAIYIGNGKMVEARGTKWGVLYCDVRNTGAIVAVCRPL